MAVGWSDGSAAVYSLFVNSQLVRFLGPPKPVSQVDYSPDSRTVAVGAADGSVRIWRTGGAESAYAELGSRIDWDLPVASKGVVTVVTPPGLIRKLKLPGLVPLSTFYIPRPPRTRFTYAWLSPSGGVAVMIRNDDRADVWDLRRQRQILSLSALQGDLVAVPVHATNGQIFPDGSGGFSCTLGSTDFTFDPEGSPVAPPSPPDPYDPSQHAWTEMILLDGEHNELVDLQTGTITPIRERARFCRGSWRAARFSDDDSIVVAGANCGEALVWNARTGKLIRRSTLAGQITGLALAHDRRTIAAASPDGRLALIDLATGTQRLIPGAPRGINSLDFGARDRILAAGAADKTVRVWDVADQRLLRELPLQAAAAARFTPDGHSLIAMELTGVISVFAPCPGCENAHALQSEGARRATRKLTAAERRTYLSGF